MHALVFKFSFRSCFPANILSKEVRLTTGSCSALELVKRFVALFWIFCCIMRNNFQNNGTTKILLVLVNLRKKECMHNMLFVRYFFNGHRKRCHPLTVHKHNLHLISRLNSTVSKPYPCSHRSLARGESLGKKLNNWWKVLWRILPYVHFFWNLNTPDLPQSRINVILNLAKTNALLIENDQSK